MKLSLAQLNKHLTAKLAPIYLIAGNEVLLAQEAIDRVRHVAIQQGYTARKKLSGETDAWVEYLQAAETLSLFDEKRLIEMDFRTVKFNQSHLKIFQNALENISHHTMIIIHMNKLDAKTEQTAWYKLCDKIGVIITVWPITREQLPQWIEQRARELNLSLSLTSAKWLADQVEGNLLAAKGELEKLSLWQMEETKTSDETSLTQMIKEQSRYDIFQLTDAALQGDLSRSKRILHSLLNTDTETVLILWAITRELRLLMRLMHELSTGKNLATLFQQFYVREKSKPAYHAFIKRHSLQSCTALLRIASRIDRLIKGAARGNSEDTLEALILGMAGTATIVDKFPANCDYA